MANVAVLLAQANLLRVSVDASPFELTKPDASRAGVCKAEEDQCLAGRLDVLLDTLKLGQRRVDIDLARSSVGKLDLGGRIAGYVPESLCVLVRGADLNEVEHGGALLESPLECAEEVFKGFLIGVLRSEPCFLEE